MTVVIPTYDRPESLPSAIRTVQSQTLTNWELVIVDDASSQPVILDPDAAADKRIVVVRHTVNHGVSQARNTGIAIARAPWIAFLDDDDLWWPEKLARQLRAAAAHDSTFVFTGRYTVTPAGEVVSVRRPPPVEDLTRTLLFRNLIGEPSTVLARRDILVALGGFDTNLAVIADWDMWVRMSRVASSLGLPDLTAAIVYHGGSMQLSRALQIPVEVERMRQRHAELLADEQMALGSSITELWMGNKRWHGERSLASLLAYIKVARRHRQVTVIAKRLVRRKLREYTSSDPPALAPEWVLRQLRPPSRPLSEGPAERRYRPEPLRERRSRP